MPWHVNAKTKRVSTAVGTSRANRARRVQAARRNTNKPVKRVLRPPRRFRRTRATRNTTAIGVLARQVRFLQRARYGEYQHNRSMLIMSYSPNTQYQVQIPTVSQPLCFLLQDYNNEQQVYRGQPTDPFYIVPGTFGMMEQPEYITGSKRWGDHNQELIADFRTGFLPLKKTFELRMSCQPNAGNAHYPIRMNVKFVRMRLSQYMTQTTDTSYNLPQNILAYGNLLVRPTVDNYSERNWLNPTIHEVLFDRTYNMTPGPKENWPMAPNTANIYTRVKRFSYTFPERFLRVNADPGEIQQEMWSHIPIRDQVWCIISCDANTIGQAEDFRLKASLIQHKSWRDHYGTSGV